MELTLRLIWCNRLLFSSQSIQHHGNKLSNKLNNRYKELNIIIILILIFIIIINIIIIIIIIIIINIIIGLSLLNAGNVTEYQDTACGLHGHVGYSMPPVVSLI